jgi:hypothetical protein
VTRTNGGTPKNGACPRLWWRNGQGRAVIGGDALAGVSSLTKLRPAPVFSEFQAHRARKLSALIAAANHSFRIAQPSSRPEAAW